jgi:dipeptidyl aminopeptidase/acylaminoacyl peptidase
MTTHEPEDLLNMPDRPVAPSASFSSALLDRLVTELDPPRRQFVARPGIRMLAIAAVIVLLLVAVAAATYLLTRSAAAPARPKATLTVIAVRGGPIQAAKILAVGPEGRLRLVWQCPRPVFCGDLTSLDWSPDGRRLAFTLSEIAGRSAYVGLHILNTRTGRDLHLLAKPELGCVPPSDVAWSPDGARLAYDCRHDFSPRAPSEIFTIRRDGTDRQRLRTGTTSAVAPTWSPDGKQIAFATSTSPVTDTPSGSTPRQRFIPSSIYVVNIDGSGRRLLARDAASPDWSPDGSTIAYETPHGVKLISPQGLDLTPAGGIAPAATPRWSPDGSELAVTANNSLLVVDTATWQQHVVTAETGLGALHEGRPAWYPGSSPPLFRVTKAAARNCTTC